MVYGDVWLKLCNGKTQPPAPLLRAGNYSRLSSNYYVIVAPKAHFQSRPGWDVEEKRCPLTVCVCVCVRLLELFVLKILGTPAVEIAKNEAA